MAEPAGDWNEEYFGAHPGGYPHRTAEVPHAPGIYILHVYTNDIYCIFAAMQPAGGGREVEYDTVTMVFLYGSCGLTLVLGVITCITYLVSCADLDAREKTRQERAKNATAAEKRAMAEARYPELFRPGGPTLLDMARLNHDQILTQPVCATDNVKMAVREALEAHLKTFTFARKR